MASTNNPILRVVDLRKYFPLRSGVFRKVHRYLKAVDGISFDLGRGETLGLVGESGCGKTTAGRAILQLVRPTGGAVYLDGSPNLAELPAREMLPYRRRIQMIFQDPYSSLNPRMTVGGAIGEALTIHKLASGKAKWDRVAALLESVGLSADQSRRYPHEFSGGQRQRICIARALAVEPQVIVADEPVSALDVSIQAQIINLLEDIQRQRGLSLVFISHDLSVVAHISTRVAVMYLGKIVEIGPKEAVFNNPLHPYTKALLAAVPRADPKTRGKRIVLEGDVPSPVDPPSGCPFHPRCPEVMRNRCPFVVPLFLDVGEGRKTSCLLYDKEGLSEKAMEEKAKEEAQNEERGARN